MARKTKRQKKLEKIIFGIMILYMMITEESHLSVRYAGWVIIVCICLWFFVKLSNRTFFYNHKKNVPLSFSHPQITIPSSELIRFSSSSNINNIDIYHASQELQKMGASWFVSYSYYMYCDKEHLNWQRVSTLSLRESCFKRSYAYHRWMLKEVLTMSIARLRKNQIGLSGDDVKIMAKLILDKEIRT